MTDQLSKSASSGAPPHHPADPPGTLGADAAAQGRAEPRDLTVASVPAAHVYVRHLDDPVRSHGVARLPDPSPTDQAPAVPGRWWPPAMLDPQWIEGHDFDLMHLHFGFDAWEPARLADVLDALRRRGRPLVYTVHDLRNPHHADQSLHDAQLDVLVPRADALVTLTTGAAAEIDRRWGRLPTVLPHPHVVDLATMARIQSERRRRGPRRAFRVGLHVKSLRAGTDPAAVLPTLLETVRALPGGVLQVNAHRDVLEATGSRYSPSLATWLRSAAARGLVDLRVHDFLDDDALWRYLSSLDVSVLAYRSGTHSGWLEACRDLGTTVVAPTCGYYADQETDQLTEPQPDAQPDARPDAATRTGRDAPARQVRSFVMDADRFEPDTLADAVETAYHAGAAAPVEVTARHRQRARLADAHAELYRSLR